MRISDENLTPELWSFEISNPSSEFLNNKKSCFLTGVGFSPF